MSAGPLWSERPGFFSSFQHHSDLFLTLLGLVQINTSSCTSHCANISSSVTWLSHSHWSLVFDIWYWPSDRPRWTLTLWSRFDRQMPFDFEVSIWCYLQPLFPSSAQVSRPEIERDFEVFILMRILQSFKVRNGYPSIPVYTMWPKLWVFFLF